MFARQRLCSISTGDSQLQEVHHGERADNHLEPGEGRHRGQAYRMRQAQ
jgi:hypothetical protein